MRGTPTLEERQFYANEGFLVVSEFLAPAELTRWREVVDRAVEERDRGLERYRQEGGETEFVRDEYVGRVFTQRLQLWQTNDEVKGLLFCDPLRQFVGELSGAAGLRIWHDQALIKEPFANPTAYHLDVPHWGFDADDAITIWVALDDATLENGCLYYVPGSHKIGQYVTTQVGRDIGGVFDLYPEWRDVPAVACPVAAGGALLHNGLIIHGAGANMTPGRRRAMTCGFMPDGSRFNGRQNVLPDSYFHRLHIGDPLDDEAQNPLVFSRAR